MSYEEVDGKEGLMNKLTRKQLREQWLPHSGTTQEWKGYAPGGGETEGLTGGPRSPGLHSGSGCCFAEQRPETEQSEEWSTCHRVNRTCVQSSRRTEALVLDFSDKARELVFLTLHKDVDVTEDGTAPHTKDLAASLGPGRGASP